MPATDVAYRHGFTLEGSSTACFRSTVRRDRSRRLATTWRRRPLASDFASHESYRAQIGHFGNVPIRMAPCGSTQVEPACVLAQLLSNRVIDGSIWVLARLQRKRWSLVADVRQCIGCLLAGKSNNRMKLELRYEKGAGNVCGFSVGRWRPLAPTRVKPGRRDDGKGGVTRSPRHLFCFNGHFNGILPRSEECSNLIPLLSGLAERNFRIRSQT